MITLNITLTQQMIFAAYGFEHFRNDCKTFLAKHGKNYDKFTVVQHDSIIGFITEATIQRYISELYKKDNVKVTTWEQNFDIEHIKRIISSSSADADEVKLVEKYFYDKYDLKISYHDKSIYVDVKTALTQKNPSENWNFMYPVIQANKDGKDYMILTYYVVNDIKKVESLNKVVIVGYISENTVKQCKTIYKGEKTRFDTVSQTDNYETELAVHYNSIDELINNLKAL